MSPAQLLPHCGNNLLAIRSPFILEDILADTPSNFPAKHSESGLDRLYRLAAGRENQAADDGLKRFMIRPTPGKASMPVLKQARWPGPDKSYIPDF